MATKKHAMYKLTYVTHVAWIISCLFLLSMRPFIALHLLHSPRTIYNDQTTSTISHPDVEIRLTDISDLVLALAPVGVQKIFHRDGELGVARAADEENITYIMSTAASTSIEDVAGANRSGSR